MRLTNRWKVLFYNYCTLVQLIAVVSHLRICWKWAKFTHYWFESSRVYAWISFLFECLWQLARAGWLPFWRFGWNWRDRRRSMIICLSDSPVLIKNSFIVLSVKNNINYYKWIISIDIDHFKLTLNIYLYSLNHILGYLWFTEDMACIKLLYYSSMDIA